MILVLLCFLLLLPSSNSEPGSIVTKDSLTCRAGDDMFKIQSLNNCSSLFSSQSVTEFCNEGTVRCNNCRAKVHCNNCSSINLYGESEMEVFAHHLESFSCTSCSGFVNVFSIGKFSCFAECNITLNAYKAVQILCRGICVIRIPAGAEVFCRQPWLWDDGDCGMEVTRHDNLTEFCNNAGFDFPGLETQFDTSTYVPNSQSHTAMYSLTQQETTGEKE